MIPARKIVKQRTAASNSAGAVPSVFSPQVSLRLVSRPNCCEVTVANTEPEHHSAGSFIPNQETLGATFFIDVVGGANGQEAVNAEERNLRGEGPGICPAFHSISINILDLLHIVSRFTQYLELEIDNEDILDTIIFDLRLINTLHSKRQAMLRGLVNHG